MCACVCIGNEHLYNTETQTHNHTHTQQLWYLILCNILPIYDFEKKFLSFRFLFFHSFVITLSSSSSSSLFHSFLLFFFLLVMVSFFSNFFHWLLNNKIQELCVFVSVCVCMHVQCNNNHNNSLVEYNIMKKKNKTVKYKKKVKNTTTPIMRYTDEPRISSH